MGREKRSRRKPDVLRARSSVPHLLLSCLAAAGAAWASAQVAPLQHAFIPTSGAVARALLRSGGGAVVRRSALDGSDSEEGRKSMLLDSMMEALKPYQEEGRCFKVDLQPDAPFHGMWRIQGRLPGLLFDLFLVEDMHVSLKVLFGGDGEPITPRKLQWVNAWNRQKRWAKAIVEEDGTMVIEYDLFFLEQLSEPAPSALIAEALLMFEQSAEDAAYDLVNMFGDSDSS